MKEKEILYYEKAACDIWGLANYEDLFKRTRVQNVVFARNFCMYYMRTELKYSFAACSARYALNHATALHGIDVVNSLRSVDKEYDDKFNKFLKKTLEAKAKLNNDLTFQKVIKKGERGNHVDFLYNFIRSMTELQLSLFSFIDFEEDYAAILEKITITEYGLSQLREFFNYDDKGTVDTED